LRHEAKYAVVVEYTRASLGVSLLCCVRRLVSFARVQSVISDSSKVVSLLFFVFEVEFGSAEAALVSQRVPSL
jgi:hypothetical protein